MIQPILEEILPVLGEFLASKQIGLCFLIHLGLVI